MIKGSFQPCMIPAPQPPSLSFHSLWGSLGSGRRWKGSQEPQGKADSSWGAMGLRREEGGGLPRREWKEMRGKGGGGQQAPLLHLLLCEQSQG